MWEDRFFLVILVLKLKYFEVGLTKSRVCMMTRFNYVCVSICFPQAFASGLRLGRVFPWK